MSKKASNTTDDVVRSDQLMPHSIDAEKAVLGSILISSEALYEVMGFLKPEAFFLVRHAWIYEAMLGLQQRKDKLDYFMVLSELEQMGRAAEIGGAAYLLGLLNATPSALNAEGYGRIVERMALRRGLIDAASQIARIAHSDETEIDVVLSKAEKIVFDATRGGKEYRTVNSKQLAASIYDMTIAKTREGHIDTRVFTYQTDVDRITGGFHAGDLIYVGARTSMGKTAWTLSVLAENARHGVKGGFISLEMGVDQIGTRLIAAEAAIPYQTILDGKLDPNTDEFMRFLKATDTFASWEIPIDDTAGLNPSDVRTILRRMKYEDGIEFAVVDYVQRMSGGLGYDGKDARTAEVSYISRQLKDIARDLNIVIIAPVQLSRALEARKNKRAILPDMQESGSLEQDADFVIFPYRDSYYSGDETNNVTEIHVAKNRHGHTGTCEVIYLKERMKFVDAVRHHFDLDTMLESAPAPSKPLRPNGNGSDHGRSVYGQGD